MSDADPAASDGRDLGRLIAAAIVIVAFIALAGLAIAASRSSLSIGLPAAAEQAPQAPPQALPDVPNLASFASPAPADLPPPAPETPPTAVEAAAGPTTTTTLPPPPALAAQPTAAACPQLGLLAPDDVGGLQSLVALIPLFGPFSPEAFALLPAFEPGFQALGPLFPVFGQGLDQLAPVLTPLTPVVRQLEEAGFTALAPLYGPQRQSVLAAEQQLAAQLAPVVQQLATAPGSECLVALEGLLASAVPK
jgi:hypothetical protein